MLRHQKESEQTHLYRPTPPAPEQAPSETIPAIEIYLDKTYLPSLGDIEGTHRAALRYEMRANLMAAVRLREDRGLSRQQAITDTLRDIDSALREVEEQATTRAGSNVKLTTGFDLRDTAKAAVLFGVPYVLDATRVSGGLWDRYVNRPDTLFYGLELFAIPALAGIVTGLASRKSGPRAVLAGLTTLAVAGLLVPSMLCMVNLHSPSEWGRILGQFANPAGVGVSWWMLLGCLGAVTGQRLSGRKRRQHPLAHNRQRVVAGLKTMLSRDTAIAFAVYAAPAAMILSNRGPLGSEHLFSSNVNMLTLLTALFGLPLASGLVTGLTIHKSPVKAGLRALGALAALLILLPSLVEAVSIGTSINGPFMFGTIQVCAAGFLGWWAVLGSIGTFVGHSLRGGKGQKPARSIAGGAGTFLQGKSGDPGSAFTPKRKDREPIALQSEPAMS